ncbi:MAG: dicarboxylate/amino acid:cation symporter [Gemmatimonadetes bacterium]|nr:dicarboxylate/amino acid:cation symporter [Gemmatimonadota bacterium]
MNNQIAIAIGLAAGLLFGLLAAATGSSTLTNMATSVQPIGTAFVNLVRMVVIPLVATTIFTGVAGLGDPKKLGKLGGSTLAFFWSTTFIAIMIGMAVMKLALIVAPVTVQLIPAGEAAQELPSTMDFLLGLIPSNPFESAANGALLPLIVFMVLFGTAAGTLEDRYRTPLLNLAEAVTTTLIKLVRWILWTAPVGVFALAAPMTATSGIAMLQNLAVFVIAVAVGLFIFVAVVYLPCVVFLGGMNLKRFIEGSSEPVIIATGATSSAAALPAMLEQGQAKLGVSRAVAGLVYSMGAAIGRGGSALFQGTAVIFLAALYGVSLNPAVIVSAIIAVFLVSMTVAGVPSASLVTLAPALDVAGVPFSGLAVLFGIDRIPDMLRTAVNVTGHMTTSVVVEKQIAQVQ